MRVNVYTEELMKENDAEGKLCAQVVYAEYTSSRTGQLMRNYGLRIFVKSHPDLHYVPPRDDDRSAITFWCGEKEKNVFEFWENIRAVAHMTTLDIWREKTEKVQRETEAAETIRRGE